MQSGTEQLKRQQLILKLKGFYNGALDGIWSAKTIAAKKQFEAKGFTPGIPNNGLPFSDSGPFPKGIRVGRDGLLTCAEVEQYIEDQKTKKPKEERVEELKD